MSNTMFKKRGQHNNSQLEESMLQDTSASTMGRHRKTNSVKKIDREVETMPSNVRQGKEYQSPTSKDPQCCSVFAPPLTKMTNYKSKNRFIGDKTQYYYRRLSITSMLNDFDTEQEPKGGN